MAWKDSVNALVARGGYDYDLPGAEVWDAYKRTMKAERARRAGVRDRSGRSSRARWTGEGPSGGCSCRASAPWGASRTIHSSMADADKVKGPLEPGFPGCLIGGF